MSKFDIIHLDHKPTKEELEEIIKKAVRKQLILQAFETFERTGRGIAAGCLRVVEKAAKSYEKFQ